MMAELLEQPRFLLREAAGYASRDVVHIAENQDIVPGQLLGARVIVADASATVTAAAGNVGNGVLALASPKGTGEIKSGRYTVEIISAASNAGTFRVEDPGGHEIGNGSVGAAFDKEIKFTVADGLADFVVGDRIFVDVVVEPADLEFIAFDPDGTDGAETVKAIAMQPATTGPGEARKILAFRRLGEVNGREIVLPDGLTSVQTAKAYADLAELKIQVRT